MSKPFTSTSTSRDRIHAYVTTVLSAAVVVLLGAVQIGVLSA